MRVAGTSLAVSLLLLAGPALAQGGGYYDYEGPYSRQQMNPDRFERYDYYPSPRGQGWQRPMQYGPMRHGQRHHHQGQQPDPQWRMQSGPMQQDIQGGYPPPQMAPSPTGPVSATTQSQIKSSLESSGFKNVTVVPQSYLIRATAPDGSRIIMQVSSDALQGVVVPPTDQARTTGAGTGDTPRTTGTRGTDTGDTGKTTGTGDTGKTTGTGDTDKTTGTGESGAGAASSSTDQTTTR
jgi:hypothetical protein